MWTLGGWRDNRPFLAFQPPIRNERSHAIYKELHLSGRAIPIIRRAEDDQIGFLHLRVNLSHSVFQGAYKISSFAGTTIHARKNLMIVQIDFFTSMSPFLTALQNLIHKKVGITSFSGASNERYDLHKNDVAPSVEMLC